MGNRDPPARCARRWRTRWAAKTSAAGCERALEEQAVSPDGILGAPMRYGMGYGLHSGWLPSPRTCFWGGWGGSMVLVDLDARMTVSYVMNQMLDQGTLGDDRALIIMLAAYEGLSARSAGRPPWCRPLTRRRSRP